MTERAYTVNEIDALRRAVENKWLFGSYNLQQMGQMGMICMPVSDLLTNYPSDLQHGQPKRATVMMFETATAADIAEALKGNRPTVPKDENQSPEVQIWREWCAIVRTVAQVYFEREQDLQKFYRACGMPH